LTKDDFAADDWHLIVSAPSLVGLAVSAASPSGPLGVVKEMLAVGMSIMDLAAQRPDNELIQAVVDDIRHRESEMPRPETGAGFDDAKAWALNELGKISQLLPADEESVEAFEFRGWLVAIADRVAEASKEGGFFGIGGEKVSEAEESAIDEVAGALGQG